ncbi:5-oxoprolinase subunit C family protein [Gelidibacter pelagius]|uniref:Biotin-dependent carboxyltransferase family protein n=1 Tax=Gelidibacter pelagius TaxID=2819985 RepID=A0ABS3SSC4_9FLAO|nr:biotin-dependent carboxyltransferase family protein [Gelidibacter pelagius]MBO3098211.1 biotin-dependent carboxyltransferase family protein [Gelidibacter pelagius]
MVEILKTGLYDSIQDLGRLGYQEFGVPISGAMDHYSAKLANAILGNQDDAAVLEFTLMAPRLKFQSDTAICITGMESQAKINEKPIGNNSYTVVRKNDVLSFGARKFGCRGYLAVLGGFQSERIMESRSFYKCITNQQRLKTGDVLKLTDLPIPIKRSHSILKTPKTHFESGVIEVFKSIEYELLEADNQNRLFNNEFTISKDSNRMAYQLDERFENAMDPIITSPVLPGTVQLTPAGQLMILMRDCQTTGGYPRILQLSEMAFNRLSQKTPGQTFRFHLLTL